jgi:competence protein ComEC
MTLRRPPPAHLLAAALCAGLALANVTRLHGAVLVASLVAGAAVAVADSPAMRLVLAATALVLLGWWWASLRLDALDRSPMLAQVGRSGRAIVTLTAAPSRRSSGLRAPGRLTRFEGTRVSERVELELPLGRSPPQGAVIEALAVVALPSGPEHGFDERTWLRRHGVHVVLHVDEWRQVGRRGGLGGLADRLRAELARSIAPGLAGERRAVLEGIVLGDDDALSDGLRQDFRASGLYHLLSVAQ